MLQKNCVRSYVHKPDCLIISLRKNNPTSEERLTIEYQFRKNEILNVYLDRKTAATLNGYSNSGALDNIVKNKTLSNDHYYILYDDCDEHLKNDFVNKNNDNNPLLYKNGVGQYDSNNNLIKEFACKYDCIRSLSISDKTLQKALDKKLLYNGYYYKIIGEKLSCL